MRAPWLPPTTNTLNFPLLSEKRTCGDGISNKSWRTGFPTTSASLNAVGKACKTRVAIFANHSLVKPATAFCSCKITGTPQSFAAIPPGPDT